MSGPLASNILEVLKSMNLPSCSRAISGLEREIAEKIFAVIRLCGESTTVDITEDEELVTTPSEEEIESEIVFEPLAGPDNEFFSLEYINQVLDFKDSRNISFRTLQHRFRRVRHDVYLTRFREYRANCGTTREKYKRISSYTWDKFLSSRAINRAVHDVDLRRWALEKARELQLTSFRASNWWINEFKEKNKIVSRRVTNFVSYKHQVEREEIETSALTFTEEINNTIITLFQPDEIFNTDQSGFNYEMHRDRTLEISGQRSVDVRVESMRAKSHSYTIQPIITMGGHLLSPLMIVLQEPSGQFGPVVSRSLIRPPNIFLTATKSGKVEMATLQAWKIHCFSPNIVTKACLILDSFSSHRTRDALLVEGKQIEVKFIPPGATSLIQPLDVFFFRQWKSFVKRFSDRILIDNLDIDLHARNTIIKLHSFIHNQFSAPIFNRMIQAAWMKSGYNVRQEIFDHPDQTIFDIDSEECSNPNCITSCFIQCAYCRKKLCLNHCFVSFHHH